jgi:hypothetical protein
MDIDLSRINGYQDYDDGYLRKCIKILQKWNAPLENWECIRVVDIFEDDDAVSFSTCDVCGCSQVRYEHHMVHEDYFDVVKVGCICAGIMEGDILKAKERDRLMKNRSKRRKNFVKKEWQHMWGNTYKRTYKKKDLYITAIGSTYKVSVGSDVATIYKGKPIRSFFSAMYAAFDLADPISEVMNP